MAPRILVLATTALALAGAPAHSASGPTRTTTGRPVALQVRRDGFHFGDAAIGLAAGTGLGLATSGLVLLRRTQPRRHPSTQHRRESP
jgi:hypothetical protein